MSNFEVRELRSAVNTLTAELERLHQAAEALLRKFEPMEGLSFTEFDKSLAVTSGWQVLADTIGTAGQQVQEQSLQLQRAGAHLLEPFDTARQLKAEAATDAADRANRAYAYASAEKDTRAEADALRLRLRNGEKLSAPERDRAHELGVFLAPTDELATSHW